MDKTDILKKISNKETKLVGLSQKPDTTKDLLRDIRLLYNEIERIEMEEVKNAADAEIKSMKDSVKPEQMHFCIPQSEVVDEYDMGSCAVTKTTFGYEWRTKGGFRLYTDNDNNSLSSAMESFFELRNNEDVRTEQELEQEKQIMSAITYILNYPMIAFSDSEFMLEMATRIVQWINEKYNELINQPLHEDDNPQLTREFEKATLALEDLKDALPDEGKTED